MAASRFVLDCKSAAKTNLIQLQDLEKYFVEKFKPVKLGKAGDLKDNVKITAADNELVVESVNPVAKRYIKYLTKRFLCKMGIRDYFRVIASAKDTYELRYYEEDAGEEDEA